MCEMVAAAGVEQAGGGSADKSTALGGPVAGVIIKEVPESAGSGLVALRRTAQRPKVNIDYLESMK